MELYLSDLHLGNPLFKDENTILKLLNEPKYNRIVILGDIIDTWEAPVESIRKKYDHLINQINLRAKQGPVLIIRGNHDPDILVMHSIFDMCRIFESLREGSTIFIHGHEFDELITKHYWLAKLIFPIRWLLERLGVNLLAYVRNLYHSIAAKRQNKKYNDLVIDIEKQAVSKYEKDFDYLVMGHTHLPKIVLRDSDPKEPRKCDYINVGDWIHNRTYVERDGDKFKLRKAG